MLLLTSGLSTTFGLAVVRLAQLGVRPTTILAANSFYKLATTVLGPPRRPSPGKVRTHDSRRNQHSSTLLWIPEQTQLQLEFSQGNFGGNVFWYSAIFGGTRESIFCVV